MQYDTIINDWHTSPASGRINASNPCFTGDSRVHTDKGLVRFDDLMKRVLEGETFEVYTHDITNPDAPRNSVRLSKPTQFMVTGIKEVLRLRFSDGGEIRCTPNHRLWTRNRGWVRADELTPEDQIQVLDQATPPVMADHRLPVLTDWRAYATKGDHSPELNIPEKWDVEFAHYVGWLIGDGGISGNSVATIYGSKEDQKEILPSHLELITRINGGRPPKPSVQENGTIQLRLTRRPLTRFLEALGVKPTRAANKEVPWSVFEAPEEIQAAFLRGLFDADGCVVSLRNGTRYVGLGSKSQSLVRGVQMLLRTLGIGSRIYDVTGKGANQSFTYTRKKDGRTVEYTSVGRSYDLRILGRDVAFFLAKVGFGLSRKELALASQVQDHRSYGRKRPIHMAGRELDGFEQTYNLTEPANHSYIVNGTIVANCSEYMHLDNSACNLASLNLLKFLDHEGNFDVPAFKHAVEIVFTAQEIIVGNSSYPTEKIEHNAKAFRQLGLGYANLGALLMARGLAYDSDPGRAWAGAITALMTGQAYAVSAKIAQQMGPFAGYAPNRDAMLRVMRKHRSAAEHVDAELIPEGLLTAAKSAWDKAIGLGEAHGYRNAQASVIAPTGTISFLMDCDTTGIEPDLALVKTKKLVGGGTMQIVNQTIPRALRKLGYDEGQVKDIVDFIAEHNSVAGAPHLAVEHYSVFDTSMGEQAIHYMGHVRMMAAVQPFISGAISKTVNMPEDVTVEDVEGIFVEGWRLGLKALAIYRNNCKVAQPLSAEKKTKQAAPEATSEPVRRRLPAIRPAKTFSFSVGDADGYIIAGEWPDDGIGEIFLKVAKQGSTLSGIMDAFAISVSLGLQYGVPLEAYTQKFVNMRFEPSGITSDPDIRFAASLVDYIFRRLALEYLPEEKRGSLGVQSIAERKVGNGLTGEAEPASPAVEPPTASGPMGGDWRELKVLDAPLCYQCGSKMQPSGSCYVCGTCGSTSGCS
jgi:ribonucleoside-diphosphate reductase alpha chain